MRPGLAVCLSVCAAAGLARRGTLAGEFPVTRWVSAGDAACVRISAEGVVTLRADAAADAGALSPAMPMPTGTDAVLVQATAGGAEVRAITFAVHNTDGGETVGYWQNPLPVRDVETIAVVLPLAERAARGRLFVGTHDRPSRARVADVRWQPLRRGPGHRGAIWGVRVDGARPNGQTFRANGGPLAAVAFRVRELEAGRGGPGLRVRVYRWVRDVAETREAPPLAEAIVPRRRIPPADGPGEQHIAVALRAPTVRDDTYYLEFTAAGPCAPEQAILLYAGPDAYAGGCRYENGRAMAAWDLYFEAYDAVE